MTSLPASSSIGLGFGCTVYLDIPSLTQLIVLPGNISVTFFVPDYVALAGVAFHMQAFGLDNNAPLGIVLTNGLDVTLGF